MDRAEDAVRWIVKQLATGYGKILKQWPHYLDADDRIILRLDDYLYEQRLVRITGGPDIVPVMREFSRKYNLGPIDDASPVTNGEVWMFEVVNR